MVPFPRRGLATGTEAMIGILDVDTGGANVAFIGLESATGVVPPPAAAPLLATGLPDRVVDELVGRVPVGETWARYFKRTELPTLERAIDSVDYGIALELHDGARRIAPPPAFAGAPHWCTFGPADRKRRSGVASAGPSTGRDGLRRSPLDGPRETRRAAGAGRPRRTTV